MVNKLNKTDTAWDMLFSRYSILDEVDKHGIYQISSSQINEFREARLMTKFDHSSNLPKLFSENKLSILPNSRGTYLIGRFHSYEKLKYDHSVRPITKYIPDYIQSFAHFQITSESTALNIAHMAGMIDEVIDTKYNEPQSRLTINGRMGSGEIKYKIKLAGNSMFDFSVNNSQIEIDGSYENLNKIAIIEAKNKIPEDFHIRQLYYPYRFYNKLGTNKEITPIFFTFADDIFSFHVYEFKKMDEYTSIHKINQMNFILNRSLNVAVDKLKRISFSSNMTESISVPFPQANNFSRILDLLDYLVIPKDKFELADEYSFDVRQSDYYANALVYLDLAVKRSDRKFLLNDLGLKLSRMSNSNQRNIEIIRQILNKTTFKLAFDSVLQSGGNYDKKYISKVLYDNIPTIKTWSTAERRASTVCAWLEWIFSVSA